VTPQILCSGFLPRTVEEFLTALVGIGILAWGMDKLLGLGVGERGLGIRLGNGTSGRCSMFELNPHRIALLLFRLDPIEIRVGTLGAVFDRLHLLQMVFLEVTTHS
jgi:hypothetical protein